MTSTVTFHCGDVRDVMAAMPDSSVDLIVTSPPFLALRSYLPSDHPDKHREIGSEATPADFLDTLLELSAKWRRLLTATGSLCVELGDTYSGAGGYGDPDSVNPAYNAERFAQRWEGRTAKRFKRKDDGWPLAKSLCGIPAAYQLSLTYGHNVLNGNPSPAGPWRVRNQLVWTRPNPPVGALGDKFRTSFVTVACTSDRRWFDLDSVRTGEYAHPERIGKPINNGRGDTYGDGVRSTWSNQPDFMVADRGGPPPLDWWQNDEQPVTYVTVACTSDRRWFDLDSVRGDLKYPDAITRATCNRGSPGHHTDPNDEADRMVQNPAGAPPLDWWDDAPGWQPFHNMPTAPYKGAHYATYPTTLPQRLIQAMCPLQVCEVCGEGRRRIVHSESQGAQDNSPGRNGRKVADVVHRSSTVGWSDCGHNNYRPGRVLDPFAGSGTTAVAAALCGRDAILIDIDRRNLNLTRQRLTETVRILNETVDGDSVVWTVQPATKLEVAAITKGQPSLFDEDPV